MIESLFVFGAPVPLAPATTQVSKDLYALLIEGVVLMDVKQNDTAIICVSPGIKGKWDVSEKGLETPLASFDDKEEAYAYAIALMKSRGDSTALVEDDEGFSLLPVHDDADGAGAWFGKSDGKDIRL